MYLSKSISSTLHNRAKGVFNSNYDTLVSNLKIFFEFINKKFVLKCILREAERDLPDFDPLIRKMIGQRQVLFPDTNLEKIKLCLSALYFIMEGGEESIKEFFMILHKTNFDVLANEIASVFLHLFMSTLMNESKT